MNGGDDDRTVRLRHAVYGLLIAVAAAQMTGRLLAVNSVSRAELEQHFVNQRVAALEAELRAKGESDAAIRNAVAAARPQIELEERRQTPFLSSNDRSRWLAVRALVDEGTFAIDGVLDRRTWNTIDMVQHRGRDGELHLYSSKPPLLTVLVAAEYWLVQAVTGWTLADNPYEIGRLMVFTLNVLPVAGLLLLVVRWGDRFATSDFARIFIVAAAAFGTLLVPFAVALNNHTIAAVATGVALEAFLRVWLDGDRRLRWFAVAGLAAAFAAADDLPALSLLAALGVALAWVDMRGFLRGFLPAAGLVVAAFFATNYAVHDSWRPPYAHRSQTDPEDNWYDYSFTVDGVTRDSYWRNPQGIDRGEPSRAVYAMHMLVGHHGVFSLTPVWLLSVWGLWRWGRGGDARLRWLAAGIAAVSLACIVFYAFLRPEGDRNYGGMTCGFRWLLWLAPLWLAAMAPAVDRLTASRRGRAVALALLALSVLSASYPTWNPWTSPWIHNALIWLDQ